MWELQNKCENGNKILRNLCQQMEGVCHMRRNDIWSSVLRTWCTDCIGSQKKINYMSYVLTNTYYFFIPFYANYIMKYMLCVKCKKNKTIREEFQYCIVCRDETGMCWRCTKKPCYEAGGQKYDCCSECIIILDGACIKCGKPSNGTGTKLCIECESNQ